jgi:alanine racemase
VIQQVTGKPVFSVLKADGYGHGAKAVARTLERAGSAGICVALLEEAIELRSAGIKLPILVMGGHFGAAWGDVLRHNLTPVLHDPAQVEGLAEEIRYAGGEPVAVHVKIDTGMARLGVPPREVAAIGRALSQHREVVLDGLMTHFACADSGDTESVRHQLELFDQVTAGLRKMGHVARVRHAANSAALLSSPETHLDPCGLESRFSVSSRTPARRPTFVRRCGSARRSSPFGSSCRESPRVTDTPGPRSVPRASRRSRWATRTA